MAKRMNCPAFGAQWRELGRNKKEHLQLFLDVDKLKMRHGSAHGLEIATYRELSCTATLTSSGVAAISDDAAPPISPHPPPHAPPAAAAG